MNDSIYLAASNVSSEAIASTRAAIDLAKSQKKKQVAADRARDDAMRVARADRKKAETAARLNERNARNQRNCRARKAAAEAAALAALPVEPPKSLDRAMLLEEVLVFRAWLRQPGQRFTQLRRRARLLWTARKALLQARFDLGRDPGGAELARRLSPTAKTELDRYQGVQILKQMATLEGDAGPWAGGDRKCGYLPEFQ